MSEEINVIIDNLCQRLGTSATYLIPELAKKSIAECTVGIILSALVIFAVLLIGLRMHKYFVEYDLYDDDAAFLYILPAIPGLIGLIFFCEAVYDLAGWIASPTAKAFELIMMMIK